MTLRELIAFTTMQDSVVYTGNPVWDLVSGLSTDPESHAPRWRVDLLAAGRPVERRHLVLEARRRAPATGG